MTYAEFKTTAHEFFTLAKTMSKPEQIDAGFKALGLAWFELEGSETELHQAAIVLELASRKQDELLLTPK